MQTGQYTTGNMVNIAMDKVVEIDWYIINGKTYLSCHYVNPSLFFPLQMPPQLYEKFIFNGCVCFKQLPGMAEMGSHIIGACLPPVTSQPSTDQLSNMVF